MKGNIIQEATFMSDATVGLVSTASLFTEKIKNLPISKATAISSAEIINELGGLPKQFHHCADLARDSLVKAVKNYQQTLFDDEEPWEKPWKKLFKKWK